MNVIHRLSVFQIIVASFGAAVLLGAFLLMLPVSSAAGTWTPFLDALFTSVSATCVTGLVVYDTGTYWSLFGEIVIIVLIQIGGMGVVTVAMILVVLSGQRVSLMQRSTLQEAVAAPQLGGIVQMLRFIGKWVFLIELLGALCMAPVFIETFGMARGLWFAVFHSISSFCNAGFDLMGIIEPGSSLIHFASSPSINLSVMALIVVGGLGFITWADVSVNGFHFHRYRLQTKMILVTTALLIFIPAVVFFLCDFAGVEGPARFWVSLFQSVTARTAGYNTVDFGTMTEAGRMLLVVLMVIGGAPGSTAGGVKVTTLFTVISSAIATFRQQRDVNVFGRRIGAESMRLALAVVMMYLALLIIGSLVISYSGGFSMLDALFEAASAIGTVGLSIGVTADADTLTRSILMFLMFFGRVGGLTLIYALQKATSRSSARYPEEKVSVG